MAGVALANMDWVGVAEIGLVLKVEWGPVFAASLGKRLTSAALFVTRPAAIRHPSPTSGHWLSAVVADQLRTETISPKANIFQIISTIYTYDML